MIMKVKYLIFILFIGFIIQGCENEFLNEAPVSEINTLSFFATERQFEQAVNAAYSDLRILAGSGSNMEGAFWAFGEMRSDNATFQHNLTDQAGYRFWNLDQFIMDAQNEILSTTWNACYAGIGKCNNVLKYLEGTNIGNKDRFAGEVRFLRALYYFTLVRAFGDVPLVTRPATSYNEAFEFNKRVPTSQVYELIYEDLNFAKQNLPKSFTGNNAGRATEGAARTLLAQALMYNQRYSDAIPELEAVKNRGVYGLLDDYASVFSITNERNKEIIFAVQFIEGPFGLGSANMYRFLPWNSARTLLPLGQLTARTGMNIPSEDLIDSFEEGDKRLNMINLSYVDNQYGTYRNTIVPYTLKQMHPGHTTQGITGNDWPLMRYPLVLLKLAECYLRVGGGDPVPLVNQVRTRAGLAPLSTVTLENIIHERRVEFHNENDRWHVLVRTGIVEDVMKAYGERERARRPNVATGRAFETIKILYPIPATVLANDPTMEQNPEHR
jgi:starch-binding outer membrane protein, SusD/RagB family